LANLTGRRQKLLDCRRKVLAVEGQGDEHVLGAEPVVAEAPGLLDRCVDHGPGGVVTQVEHAGSPPAAPTPDVVLLVCGLPRHSECFGDGLPGPPQRSGVVDVEFFELLDQLAQRSHRGETEGRVAAVHGGVELDQAVHVVNLS
jgi:hypothetical protein